MSRSSILERLYELDQDKTSDNIKVTKLMYDVLHNRISVDDAESELKVIDPFYIRYEFLQNLKGKPIYKNIQEFRKGNLSIIETMKMVSSLVTQILIQVEHDDTLNPKSLQIDDLLNILSQYSNDPLTINTELINSLLDSYGWKEEKLDDNQ